MVNFFKSFFILFYRMTIAVINYIAFSRKRNRVYIEMCNRSRIGNQMFFLAFGETLRKDLACCVLYHTNVKKDYCFLIDPFIYRTTLI